MSRSKMARLFRALPVLFVGACFVLPLRAYDLIRGPGGARVTWNDGTIPLVIRMPSTPTLQDGTNYVTSVQAAVQAWNAQMARVQLGAQVQPPGLAGSANGINEVVFDSAIYSNDPSPMAFGANTLAVTVSYRSANPRSDGSYTRIQADILFNSSFPWNSYRGPLQATEDIRRVALHELGHVLGLNHPDQVSQTVATLMNSVVGDIDALQSDDFIGAQFLYGRPGGFAPPANDHWQNAMPVSLGSGIASVIGSSVGASKELGEPNISASNVGGASVWWKWTSPVGGTLSVSTAGSRFDSLLAAFAGEGLDLLTPLAANDDSGVLRTSAISFYTVPGQTYYFGVDGKNGEWGHVVLTFDFSTGASGTVPVITRQPQLTTAEEGGVAYFSVEATGSPAPALRWERNPAGTTSWQALGDSEFYSGTATGFLMVRDARANFSGDSFRCVATNPLGSVTSASAVLTVGPAAPRIVAYPQPVQVLAGANVTLSVSASGSGPLSFQWYNPNSQPISGATAANLQLLNVQGSGYYYVIVSNGAGTSTAGAFVTVVNGPIITSHPKGRTVMAGGYVSLSVLVAQNANHTYQWYRNGVEIQGATHDYLDINYATVAASGDYTVVVTNAAGSTTSQIADVVVYPLEPVDGRFGISVTNSSSRQPGQALDMTAYVEAPWSAGVTYQWYRDGLLVPGATSNRYYVQQSSVDEFAEYFVTATTSAGTAVSDSVTISYSQKIWNRPVWEWIDAQEHRGIVYFLFKDAPRVERYSVADETWLPMKILPVAPKGFTFDGDDVYLALATGIFRADLAFSDFVAMNSATDVTHLLVRGGHLLGSGESELRTFNKQTGVPIASRSLNDFRGAPLYLPASGRIYAQGLEFSPHLIKGITWASDGTFPGGTVNTSVGFEAAQKLFALPGGDGFVAAHGAVYSIDEPQPIAGLGGIIDDLQWLPQGGAAVVRYGQLLRFDATWRELGRKKLGLAAQKIALKTDHALCFAQPNSSGQRPPVTKVALDTVLPQPRASVVNPVGLQVWSPQVFADGLGIIYVHSPLDRNVIRWSANQGAYLPSVPVSGSPRYLSVNIPQHALFYNEGDFLLRRISLENASQKSADQHFFSVGRRLEGAFSAREFLVTADGDTNSVQIQSIGPDSRVRGRTGQGYGSTDYAYAPVTGEIYFQRRYSSTPALHRMRLAPNGELSARISAPNASVFGMEPQHIRVSPDGAQLVLGLGQVVDALSFVPMGNVGREMNAAAWASGKMHTLQRTSAGCRVVRWSESLGIEQATAFSGQPLGLFAVPGGRLVLVTRATGLLSFRVLNPATHQEISPVALQGAPQILASPESQTVRVGNLAHFSAAAQGSSPQYQWQRNGVPLQDEAGVRGSGGPVLVIETASNLWAGEYRVIVSNDAGTAVSSPASLTVLATPQSITFEPIADREFTRTPIPLVARTSSGLPVEFFVTAGPALVEGNHVQLTGAGNVTVRARQAGNADYSAVATERMFTVHTNRDAWLAMHFTAEELGQSLGQPIADPDGDGITNLLEYALDCDPRSASTLPLTLISDDFIWTFTYSRPAHRADITYAVEVSADLEEWTEESVTHEWVATEGDRDTWRARHPRSSGPLFFRLKVTVP